MPGLLSHLSEVQRDKNWDFQINASSKTTPACPCSGPANLRRQFALLDFSFMNVDRSVSLVHTTSQTSSVHKHQAEPVSAAGDHGLSLLHCSHWEDYGVWVGNALCRQAHTVGLSLAFVSLRCFDCFKRQLGQAEERPVYKQWELWEAALLPREQRKLCFQEWLGFTGGMH